MNKMARRLGAGLAAAGLLFSISVLAVGPANAEGDTNAAPHSTSTVEKVAPSSTVQRMRDTSWGQG